MAAKKLAKKPTNKKGTAKVKKPKAKQLNKKKFAKKTVVAKKKTAPKKITSKKTSIKPKIKKVKVDKKQIVKEKIKTQNPSEVKKTRKSSKKPLITVAPLPKIEVSNFPKNKIKSVLLSQPKPADPETNPYCLLGKKHNLNVNFRHFIKVEPLTAQEFRLQRIDILAHGAVVLNSKLGVDHYFRMCNEMRITVPDSMKFFCINEQIAYYLQKYIQYRKRKIFFGQGTLVDLVDVINKNKTEKFLLPVSDVHKEKIVDLLDELKLSYTKGIFYKTISANLSDIKSLNDYDLLVFFTPAGIKSLKQNFPNFKQGNTRIAAFGHTVAQKVKELGYRLDIFAPNPLNPSMSGAISTYLKESNKR